MVEKMDKIWMDGDLIDWDEAKIHVLTHTLHYGLGVFEGIRCYRCHDGSSAIFRLKDHIERLFDSALISGITIPFSTEKICEACKETLRANGLGEGYIRPIVFIGEGAMGVNPGDNPIQVSIVTWPWGVYLGGEALERGIRAKISSFTRHHVNVSMTKAKVCGNYANSVFAKTEAIRAGYDEAIALDTEGYVSEGSGENLFVVRKGQIKTTPLTSVLAGITRSTVIRLAKDLGYDVREERFTRDELYISEEAFFTGTAAEVTPIREVDDRTIGDGVPGPITRKLQTLFFDVVRGREKKYEEWLDRL